MDYKGHHTRAYKFLAHGSVPFKSGNCLFAAKMFPHERVSEKVQRYFQYGAQTRCALEFRINLR